MTTVHFVVPGDPETRTGGYLYDKQIARGMRAAGRRVVVHALLGPFPQAGADALDDAARVFAGLPDGSLVVVDGFPTWMVSSVTQPCATNVAPNSAAAAPISFLFML